MQQIPLHFQTSTDYSRQAYCTDETQPHNPLEIVLNPLLWGNSVLYIYGESDAGKTHLAHIYADVFHVPFCDGGNINDADTSRLVQSGCVLDNVHMSPEETLFYVLNGCAENGTKCVVTSPIAPCDLGGFAPDIISRLQGGMHLFVPPPTDVLLRAVLLKHLRDRSLHLSEDIVAYIIPRLHRTYAYVQYFVSQLDEQSLVQKYPITIPFVRQVLGAMDTPMLDV